MALSCFSLFSFVFYKRFGAAIKYNAAKYATIPKIILINQIGITVLFLNPIPNLRHEPSRLNINAGLINTVKVNNARNITMATNVTLFFTNALNIVIIYTLL